MKHKTLLAKALAIAMVLSLIPQTAISVHAESITEGTVVTDENAGENDQKTIEPSIAAAEQEETPQETTPSGEAETSSDKEDEAGSPGTAFFEKEDVRYPVWSYEYKDPNSDVSVRIDAPEGAFPEGLRVNIKRVASEKIVDAIRDASGAEDVKPADVVAYDFDFYKDDEHHIEPEKEISVSFCNVSLGKDEKVSAYHLENEDASADEVKVHDVDEKTGSVALAAGDFSIYAIVSSPAAATDGKIWIGDDETTTYSTINDAVNAAGNGDTIHIKGKFGENGAASTGATISKNITLDIAGNTVMTGNSNFDGITLTGGTKIRCSNGSTLTMSEFQTALTVNSGAEVNDGTYIFKDNKSTTRGINIQGSVKGSADRDSVVIKADDKAETNFYSGNATFENATIEIVSRTWTWKDTSPLNLKNVSMTLSGFGQGYYVGGGSIIDSYLYMKHPGYKWGFLAYGSTGIAFQNSGSIVSGSTIRADYGSNAGISVGLSNSSTAMTFENSTLDFRNGGTGGFNVNTGDITLKNTLLKGDGKNSGALYGAQTNGKITITDSSRVESPATQDSHNGLGQAANNYVVTGGSFRVKYTTTYQNGAAVPTNGDANGNEKLDLVTLADASVNEVTVLNKLDNMYSYAVANASGDGKKHIFVPTNKVTFDLNSATAAFADGTTVNKQVKAVRGNTIALLEGGSIPPAPTNTNSEMEFEGWYYTDAGGSEQPFTDATYVRGDMTVKAKWKAVQTITYNGTLEGDMLIGEDTGHTAVKPVNAGDVLDFTGRLNVEPIKMQIRTLSSQYGGDIDKITTQNIKSIFSAELTFPTDLILPGAPSASLTDNELFEISETVKDGDKITVKMALKKNYTKFTDILDDITDVPDTLDVTVHGIKVADTVADASLLTTKGNLTGTFSGKATNEAGKSQMYDFKWTAVQTAGGKDAAQDAGDDTSIRYTVKASNPTVLAMEETIPGDILIGDDTEHTALHDVKAGDTLTYTGRLYVAHIKDKIDALKARYTGNLDLIDTADIKSIFVTTLKVPAGLTIPDVPTAVLTDNELFEITGVVKDGDSVKITMTLKKDYNKFTDLYNDVIAVPDILNIDIPGIKADASNEDAARLTVTGTVNGTFTGKATAPSGKSELYNFKWKAVQSADGKDYIQDVNDNTTIQYTVKVSNPTTIIGEEKLYGDILVGGDTEHTAVHMVDAGENVTYTGRLFVSQVKEKVNALYAQYTGNPDKILTENIESTFITRLTVPSGITIPETPTATLTDNPLFEISEVKKDGSSVVITMRLKKEYSKFTDLLNDVNSVPDILDVDVPNLKIDSSANGGTRLTITGTVDGVFKGKATNEEGKSRLYDFKWTARQIGDGRDYIQAAGDEDTIQYTVEVRENPQPGEKTIIIVNKVWKGKTGSQAIIEVYDGDGPAGTATLTEAGQWSYTFKLPKYDSHGNVISYTVKEHEVPGYVSEINKKADGSYEVVNTWKGSDDNGGGTKPGGKANTAAEKGGPVTGDDSHTALWFTAMLISCSLLTANIVFLKKRRKER